MAKDPALLWYPSDWISGTMGMSFEEKGAYMELLMMQFNRGHMTTRMTGQAVGKLWDNIMVKFKQDENGLWYNIRLESEQMKRRSYVASRNNNKNGTNQHSEKRSNDRSSTGHMTTHTKGHMEDENVNVNTTREPLEDENGNPIADPAWVRVEAEYMSVFGMLGSGLDEDDLHDFTDELGADLVCYAIEVAKNRAPPPQFPKRFILAILADWRDAGVRGVKAAKVYSQPKEPAYFAARYYPEEEKVRELREVW